jgi:hypothetical protein
VEPRNEQQEKAPDRPEAKDYRRPTTVRLTVERLEERVTPSPMYGNGWLHGHGTWG